MAQITKPCGCVVDQVEITNSVAGSSVTAIAENIISECFDHAAERQNSETQIKNLRIKNLKEMITKLEVEKEKANSLGYTDIVSDKNTEITSLQTELAGLEI